MEDRQLTVRKVIEEAVSPVGSFADRSSRGNAPLVQRGPAPAAAAKGTWPDLPTFYKFFQFRPIEHWST